MNIEKMKELLAYMKQQDELRFDMSNYLISRDFPWTKEGEEPNICKTAGCIAGHVIMMQYPLDANEIVMRHNIPDTISDEAARWLEISSDDASELFEVTRSSISMYKIKQRHALRAIEICIERECVPEELWDEVMYEMTGGNP